MPKDPNKKTFIDKVKKRINERRNYREFESDESDRESASEHEAEQTSNVSSQIDPPSEQIISRNSNTTAESNDDTLYTEHGTLRDQGSNASSVSGLTQEGSVENIPENPNAYLEELTRYINEQQESFSEDLSAITEPDTQQNPPAYSVARAAQNRDGGEAESQETASQQDKKPAAIDASNAQAQNANVAKKPAPQQEKKGNLRYLIR